MISDRLPPPELRHAVEKAIEGVGLSELTEASERLSAGYRSDRLSGRQPAEVWTDLDCLAYVAVRMPATYRAALNVLRDLRERCPELRIESMLDIGSGPATCLWAAWSELEELVCATLIESDPAMVELAKRLALGSSLTARVSSTWWVSGVATVAAMPAHDLVVAGYILAELDAKQRRSLVDDAWRASRGAVAFIEPGSTDGFRRIMEARDRLITLGARVVAPCPHDGQCPMPSHDWCHFAARLNRTSLQRRLKKGALGYEDEKYAYVLASRGSGAPSAARVVRRPRIGTGRVTLRVCRPGGLSEETVTRRQRGDYRVARKLRWGDAWR